MKHAAPVLTIGALLAAASVPLEIEAADTTLDTVKAFGLIGDWAENCTADAGYGNWRITYYTTDAGQVRRRATRRLKEGPLDSAVDSAERLDATTVKLRVRYDDKKWGPANGNWFETVLAVSDGRAHSVSASDNTGHQIIKDGKLEDGQPAPTFERCGAKQT
jgi:hypothetical protein